MFNKVFKAQQNNSEEAYRLKVKSVADKIILLLIQENLIMAECQDTLTTVQNHLQRKNLALKVSDVLKKPNNEA